MDQFSYKLLIENLRERPEVYASDQFSELILTIPTEDLQEVAAALMHKAASVKVSNHKLLLLSIVWPSL